MRMTRFTITPCVLATCLFLLLTFSPAAGDDAATPKAAEADEKGLIKLMFPENVEVKLLVDYVSKRMGLNILYDQSIGSNRITLIAPTQIPKDSLLDLMHSVLKMAGLAMIDADQPGWKRIVASKDFLSTAKAFETDPAKLATARATAAVTQMFQLEHVDTKTIDSVIKPFLSKPGGNSFTLAGRNVVVVTDYVANVRRMAAMIALVDQPGRKASIQFIDVKHRDAAGLVTEVTALLGQKASVSSSSSSSSSAARTDRNITLTAQPLTNRIAIVSLEGADKEALELIKKLDVAPKTETRTYRFKHVKPSRVEKLARDLLDRGKRKAIHHSVVDEESATLIVEAPEATHERIAELQIQLDIPPDVETRTYVFKHIAPRRVESLARQMVADDVRKTYKSVTDAESGMLIVTASSSLHAKIKQLKDQLDVEDSPAAMGNVVFYKLLNTTAADVMATIQAIDSDTGSLTALAASGGLDALATGAKSGTDSAAGKGTGKEEEKKKEKEKFAGPNHPPAAGGQGAELPKPPAYKETDGSAGKNAKGESLDGGKDRASVMTARTSDASVTADPNTNTLIVIAPPSVQKIYKQLISILDRRRPQVMIEVTMVTLDTSNNFSVGVEIGGGGSLGSEGNYVTFGSFGLSSANSTTGRLAITPGVGFNGAIVSPHIADVVIRALSSSGHTKVLSSPRILVNDNASASLSSVSEAPFTSVNASSTVSTTSFAGYASAGTTVSVTPHISEGEHINLQYSITLNSFTGSGSAGVPPPRQTNNIDSEITIPDGHAVIVGGLTRKDASESIAKIPLLGDIPVLEYIFSSRSKSNSQSTLFVFIRPVVLRDDQFEDLKYLSRRDRQEASLPSQFPTSSPLLME